MTDLLKEYGEGITEGTLEEFQGAKGEDDEQQQSCDIQEIKSE